MCGTCAKSAFTSLIPSSLAPARATVLIPGTRDWIRVFITQFPCGERTGVPASAMGIKKCATARMHARISRDSVVGWKRSERDSAGCRRAVRLWGTDGIGNLHPGSAVRSARHGLRSRGIGPLDPPPAAGRSEDENRRKGNAQARTSMAPSFPGSAWERTAGEAPPPAPGSAFEGMQAEPAGIAFPGRTWGRGAKDGLLRTSCVPVSTPALQTYGWQPDRFAYGLGSLFGRPGRLEDVSRAYFLILRSNC